MRAQIPVRLRVDRHALWARGEEIEEALAGAVERALARSREKVIEPRGGYAGVRVDDPTFTWFGEALHEIPPALRHRTEERLRAALAAAVKASRILESPPAAEEAPEPIAPRPSERVDRERLSLLFKRYRVPSYGGEGTEQVPVESSSDEGGPSRLEAVELREWELIESDEQRMARLLEVYEGRPQGRVAGVIFRNATDPTAARPGRIRFYLTAFDFRLESAPKIFSLWTDLEEFVWVKGKGYGRRRVGLPPSGTYRLERVMAAENAELRRAIYQEYYGPDIRSRLLEDAREAGVTPDDQAVEAAFREQLDKALGDVDPNTRVMAVLRSPDNRVFTIELPQELPPVPLPVELKALGITTGIAFLPRDRPPGKGGEGGGETGQGQQAKGGEGTGEEEGGFVIGPEGSEAEGRFAFPVEGAEGGQLTCEQFEDEKPVEELPDGDYVKRLIHIIALRLDIPECRFPGNFAINAATVIAGRARSVAALAVADVRATEEIGPGKTALQRLLFKPVPTVTVQYLRILAGTYPYITSLMETFRGRDPSWLLHFHEAEKDASDEGVRWIFTYACQIAFLQQLRHSLKQIQLRKDNDRYAAFFEEMVQGLLADQSRLMLLREQLTRWLAANLDSRDAVARAVIDEWRSMHRGTEQTEMLLRGAAEEGRVPSLPEPQDWEGAQDGLLAALSPTAAQAALKAGTPGSFGKKGTEWAIHDGARLWALQELDAAVAMQQGTAESIDPLVKQLLDLPGVIGVLKTNPWMTKSYLKQLLEEMEEKNGEITVKVTASATWAFEKGPISEDLEQATVPGSKYALGGIHLLAHELVGDAFVGDRAYPLGLDTLFDTEQGWRDIKSVFETAGILVLAVLCPEAAAVLGILQAAAGRAEAEELRNVYRALIDPDLVTSRSEVETQLFISELVLAISVIPEAGRIAKGVVGAGETLVKQGIRQGVKTLARSAAEALLESVVRQLQKDLVKIFLKEIVVMEVLDQVMQALLDPVIAAFQHELGPPAARAPTAADLGLQTAEDVLSVEIEDLPEYDEEDD